MKLLLIAGLMMSILFFVFGYVEVNGTETKAVLPRFRASLIGGLVTALILGLPILGILYLIFK